MHQREKTLLSSNVSHTRAVLRIIRADDHTIQLTCGISDVASHPYCPWCDAHPKTHESHALCKSLGKARCKKT